VRWRGVVRRMAGWTWVAMHVNAHGSPSCGVLSLPEVDLRLPHKAWGRIHAFARIHAHTCTLSVSHTHAHAHARALSPLPDRPQQARAWHGVAHGGLAASVEPVWGGVGVPHVSQPGVTWVSPPTPTPSTPRAPPPTPCTIDCMEVGHFALSWHHFFFLPSFLPSLLPC
jgi:hypothetical protein